MLWRSVLAVLMVGIVGVSLSLANGVISGKVETTKLASVSPAHEGNSGCQTEVDGQVIRLQSGEGIHVGKGWRNCQTYDGHPVIIYSSEPMKLANVDTDQ